MLAYIRDSLETQLTLLQRMYLIVAIGRSIIAVGQISILLITPASALFVPVGGAEPLAACENSLLVVSPYCWAPGSEQMVSVLFVVGFLWVASGFLPQVSGFVHAWLSFSFVQAVSLPDGGDHIAQVATLFLAFVSLSHDRLWYWQRPTELTMNGVRAGIAVGALWGLRLQMSWIYLNSAVAKTSVTEWQDGSAIYYVTRQEFFGAGGLFGDVVLWATAIPVVSLLITWGTILLEGTIALMLLLPGKLPGVAFVCSALLHLGIITVIGLFSFGAIMIGAVLAAAAPGLVRWRKVNWISSPPAGKRSEGQASA